jgi:anti-sigma factor RsiW
MTISDETRYQLHQRLDDVLGPDEASTLMAHLPRVGWADIATRRDLDHAVAELRGEMQTGFAELRGEMHTGFGEARAELHREIGGLHREIGGLRGDGRQQLLVLFLGLAGLQVTAAALAVGVARVL